MKQNLDLWNKLKETDPAFVVEIKGKPYKGKSPKAHYVVRKLTEQFGPCGTGWGFSVLKSEFQQFGPTDFLHYVLLEFWYRNESGLSSTIQQFGQTKAYYTSSSGDRPNFDEDAPKKSITDALIKAASYIGCCADIFMGQYDDPDYIDDLKEKLRPKDERDILCDQFIANLEKVTTRAEFDKQAGLIKKAYDEKHLGDRHRDILRPLCENVLNKIKGATS